MVRECVVEMTDKETLFRTLQDALHDWTEIDAAAIHVGVVLGIIPPLSQESDLYNAQGKKWVFWTDNPMGRLLFGVLEDMAKLNILEKNDEDDHLYRWNSNFAWVNL